MRSRKVDGPKIREARERRGLNGPAFAEALAEELGREVSASIVWKVETGHREPSPVLFSAMCTVLAVEDAEHLLLPAEVDAA